MLITRQRFQFLIMIIPLAALAEPLKPLLLSSMVLPGSGQILCGHPIRGGAFLAFGGIFASMAYFENRNYTIHYQDQLNQSGLDLNIAAANAVALSESIMVDTSYHSAYISSRAKEDSIRDYEMRLENSYRNSVQMRNMEMIWGGGLYVFNLMDALQTSIRSGRPVSGKKNPAIAAWSSALVPGLGQVYNGSLSKAGMIWMVQTACAMSALYRHELMTFSEIKLDSLEDLNEKVLADSAALYRNENLPEQIRWTTDRRNEYRRKRNSFIWYSIGFYLYNVFDALVDAHLHHFDDKLEISFHSNPYRKECRLLINIRI